MLLSCCQGSKKPLGGVTRADVVELMSKDFAEAGEKVMRPFKVVVVDLLPEERKKQAEE